MTRRESMHGLSGYNRFSRQPAASNSLRLVTTIIIAVIFLIILISIYVNLAWLHEVVPTIMSSIMWSSWLILGSCIFSPGTNLFLVMNTLIFTILVLAHRQRSSAPTPAHVLTPSSSSPPDFDDSTVDRINYADLHQLEPHDDGESKAHNHANENAEYSGAISTNHDLNPPINVGNNRDDEGAEVLTIIKDGVLCKKIMGAHMQQIECSNEAEEAQASAKASQKTVLGGGDDAFIDSLLADKDSIFARAHASRPLASAYFTHKKAPKSSDRPLSPLRTILKHEGDTLEATWMAICERKRKHLSSPTPTIEATTVANDGVFRKPRVPSSSLISPMKQRSRSRPISGLLHDDENDELKQPHLVRRRQPPMPQAELNAKVESFISTFNAQIKIQREKSFLDFMEMVGRGTN